MSDREDILLVVIMRLQWSLQIKSTKLSDLILLSVLLMLATWITRRFYKFLDVINAYGNDDLFMQGTLCSYIDVWFGFISIINHFFDTFDLLVWQL